MNKRSSVGNISYTRTDLALNKNKLVKDLAQNSIAFLQTFCAGNKHLEALVRESIRSYSVAFHFNLILSIVARLRGVFEQQYRYGKDILHVGVLRSALANEWEKQSLGKMLQTRLLTTLISHNTTFEHDLVLFRGVVDKQHKKRMTTTLSKELTFLKNIQKLQEVEEFIKVRLRDKSLVQSVIEVILDGTGLEGLNDEHPFISEDMENEVINFVQSSKLELDKVIDNDVEILSKLEIGEKYICKNFLSTSLLKSHSEKFFKPGICCFIEIIVPAHSAMFYLSPFSDFSFDEKGQYNLMTDEFEVVLPPGATFTVISRKNEHVRLYYQGSPQFDDDISGILEQWKIVSAFENIQMDVLGQSFNALAKV